MSIKGCFGKLPAHGDFVWQGLPSEFVTPWDKWQQRLMAALQQQAPDRWLESYLQNPFWRFVIRDAALGPYVWCGVLMPSVDAVGRYFPFTLADALPADAPLTSVVNALPGWFDMVEDLMLSALTQSVPVNTLIQGFDRVSMPFGFRGAEQPAVFDNRMVCGEFHGENPRGWMESISAGLLTRVYANPAIWMTHRPDDQQTRFIITDGFSSFSQAIALD